MTDATRVPDLATVKQFGADELRVFTRRRHDAETEATVTDFGGHCAIFEPMRLR